MPDALRTEPFTDANKQRRGFLAQNNEIPQALQGNNHRRTAAVAVQQRHAAYPARSHGNHDKHGHCGREHAVCQNNRYLHGGALRRCNRRGNIRQLLFLEGVRLFRNVAAEPVRYR